MRVMIIDDEISNIMIMKEILAGRPEVEVVGTCLGGREAVGGIQSLRPDLVFLDIHMPGLDGFEVLEELQVDPLPLVVFVTAYDQYALKAFTIHALDYLLKPAEDAAVHAALDRAQLLLAGSKRREVHQRLSRLLERVEAEKPRMERFVVREGDRVLFVRTTDVEAIEATGNYMHLYVGGTSHMIRNTMGSLESDLDSAMFVRTHKSWLANTGKIMAFQPGMRGTGILQMAGGMHVPVSRRFRAGVDRAMAGE